MKTKAMGIMIAVWITVVALLSCAPSTLAETAKQQPALDQGTVKMLSNILESLDTFRNDRLKDLEKIRLSTPAGNGSSQVRSDADVYLTPKNSSVSEHIQALKEGILGHNPVKKTFGYKVTVYTSPIGEDGKNGKPVLVTQYVGGDMKPDPDVRRKGEIDDLQESANHPRAQTVQSSESAHVPIHHISDESGADEGAQARAKGIANDHNRKTEHYAASDKGHQNSHLLHSKLAKGHDHEKHSAKHDEHHKETEKESHRHDTHAHDKGGATQQGIRERTEIEYYEREHFLDTEYDKAKSGHDKTSGVKEHESHNDHDSHEDKKLHAKEESSGHKTHTGTNVDKATGTAVEEGHHIIDDHPGHYKPPYGLPIPYQPHPQQSHRDHLDYKEGHQDKKDEHESSKLHHSEESKGHREHNSEKDHHSEQKDKGYVDKDKGRRKEGYRERGYKITAEREYFLNDAHHDKGNATHTSGAHLKDKEGAAHGSKEGERDRGFVKEDKTEEAHDSAYDTKERKYYDGEEHKEKIHEEEEKTKSVNHKQQQEEVLPVAPGVVSYMEPYYNPHPSHLVAPIAYSPSNAGAQALVALPPEDLKKPKDNSQQQVHNHRRIPDRNNDKNQPVGGYDDDDDYEDFKSVGYVGHAGYRKRPQSPLITSIKENIKKDVHRKPPSYSRSTSATESHTTSSEEENSVRFPDDKESAEKYDDSEDERSEEVIFPQNDNKRYRSEVKYTRNHDDDHVYPKGREQDLLNVQNEQHRKTENEKSYPEIPNRSTHRQNSHSNLYSPQYHTRETKRYRDNQQGIYTPGIQNPDKLLRNVERNAYPQIKAAKLPTVSEILEEVTRFPQRKMNKPYLEAHQKTKEAKNQQAHPELQQLYHLSTQDYGQRDDVRTHQQLKDLPTQTHHHMPTRHLRQHGYVGNLTPQQSQHPQRGLNPLEQLHQQQRQLEQLQQQHARGHQQQLPRAVTPLEQLQQQTKPPFSPVVILSRGPPTQEHNHAVDVWYTRQ